MKYAVVIEKSEDGYSAFVPDLPSCVAAGDDPEGTERLIREAIEFHLEGMRRHGEPIPQPNTIAEYISVLD